MSKEHIFSRSVFQAGKPLAIAGMLKRPDGPIGTDPPSSRILCRKHNSDLSVLDAEAGRISESVRLWHETDCAQYADADGRLLERWLLKTVTNSLVSGHADQTGWSPNPRMVQAIYGLSSVATGCGLYALAVNKLSLPSTGSVAVNPLYFGDRNGKFTISGAIVNLHGLIMFCSFMAQIAGRLATHPKDLMGSQYQLDPDKMGYHPAGMSLSRPGVDPLIVNLSW